MTNERNRLSFPALFTVGLAIFSMHFGAACMLWPTTWGRDSGSAFTLAFFGFFLSGIILPWLGYLAVSKGGGSLYTLTGRVGPRFALLYGGITVAALGPLFAVPRMSAAAWEAAAKLSYTAPTDATVFQAVLFSTVFYATTLWFLYKQSEIINKLSKVLVPLLLLMEVCIIACAVFEPLGLAVPPSYDLNPIGYGFVNGYQTMDLVCAIMFSGIIIHDLRGRINGRPISVNRCLIVTGLIGFLIMATIQFGEMYRGSTASGVFSDLSYAQLSATMALVQLGPYGGSLFTICLIFACLTTAIGLLAGTASFMSEASHGKLPYPAASLICLATALLVSCTGFDAIMTWATPLLKIIYPPCIALTLCYVFLPKFTGGLRGTCYATTLWSLLDAASDYAKLFGNGTLDGVLATVPGFDYGLAFVWPMLCGWGIGQAVSLARKSTQTPVASS